MMGPIKLFKAARAVVRVTLDPTRLDEVFVLADLSEESAQLEKILEEVKQNPRFAAVMQARPRLGAVDLDALARLPEGTVGRAYAEFMRARGLDHEDLVLVDGERELDFLRNHLRETHDLWHVVTGFDTDIAGELGVQAFYLAQFAGPLPVLLLGLGMLNTLFKDMDDADRRMHAIVRGYLLGRRAEPLFGTVWRERMTQPLAAFRRDFGLDLAAVDRVLAEQAPDRALHEAAHAA